MFPSSRNCLRTVSGFTRLKSTLLLTPRYCAFSSSPKPNDDHVRVFSAVLGSPAKTLKFVSLFGSGTSLIASPLVIMFGNPNYPLAARISMMLCGTLFSLSSTGLISHMTKPYVVAAYIPQHLAEVDHDDELTQEEDEEDTIGSEDFQAYMTELRRLPPSPSFLLETMTFWGRTTFTSIEVNDIELSQRLGLVSFTDTKSGKDFYMDEVVWKDDSLKVFDLLRKKVEQLNIEAKKEFEDNRNPKDEEML